MNMNTWTHAEIHRRIDNNNNTSIHFSIVVSHSIRPRLRLCKSKTVWWKKCLIIIMKIIIIIWAFCRHRHARALAHKHIWNIFACMYHYTTQSPTSVDVDGCVVCALVPLLYSHCLLQGWPTPTRLTNGYTASLRSNIVIALCNGIYTHSDTWIKTPSSSSLLYTHNAIKLGKKT